MPDITLTAGTLPPPACYATEQERFDAYVAATIATFSGGLQWESQQVAPTDLTKYWSQTDANERPVHQRKYSTADGKWDPWLDNAYVADSTGGTGDVITIANTPQFNSTSAFINGRKFRLMAPGTNTGPATLTVDGLAAKAIVKHNDTALEAGDIVEDEVVEVIYNSVYDKFQLISPPAEFTLDADTVVALLGEGNTTVPSAGASASISHNLGRLPAISFVRMRCLATQAGYAIGDEVDIAAFSVTEPNAIVYPALYWSVDDSAFIIARFTADAFRVNNKTTPTNPGGGGSTTVDTAKWEIVAHWL